MQDWVEVMPTSCDNSLQTCILAVTIDFGFDPTDTKDKSHPNFRQEFKLDGVTHDVWFAVVHDKYCLYDGNYPSVPTVSSSTLAEILQC